MTSSLGWLSPARRAWPLVGLALTLAACGGPSVGPTGPEGPQGPPGDPGTPGIDGPTGAQGFATLIDAVDVDRGGDCPYGGTRYDIGLDNGDGGGVARDGILQSGEVDESNFVCDAPGAVSGWEVPAGPAGTAVIDGQGGTGVNSGGAGGQVQAFVAMSGGHVQAYATGTVDTAFTLVPFTPNFGNEKLTITNGQTVTVTPVAQGGDGALAEGVVFTFINNASYREDHLWIRRGGVSYEITGLRIDAGGTLIVPPDTYRGAAILIFDADIHNGGTISSALNVRDRYWLLLGALHYYGDAGSQIDLKGGDGGGATNGGVGGSLILSLSEDTNQFSLDHYNTSLGEQSCPYWYGQGPGGFYNQGSIDITPGTMGTAQNFINARTIAICAADEIQNTGTLTAVARGSGPGGSIYLSSGEGGTQNSGTLFAEGGPGAGLTGSAGGQVLLHGAFVDNSGTIEADGGNVPAGANCATPTCQGGTGGTLNAETYGGPVRLSGDIHVSGGDAFGTGGTAAFGGQGGWVYAQSWDGWDDMLDSPVPAGDIEVAANIDISGGNSGGTGGGGGFVGLRLYGGEGVNAHGQSTSLFGYSLIDLSGGNGKPGGYGGSYDLLNGLGLWELASTCCAPSTGTSGAAVNTVHADLSGGDGVGVGANGGYGGEFIMWGRMNYAMPTAQVINRGTIDAFGGTGVAAGNYGGEAWFVAAGTVENSGAVNVSGGPGSSSDSVNGYGGYGGDCTMISQYENLAFTGSCTLSGGSGYYGRWGGSTLLAGIETDLSGSVTAPGGNGSMTTGSGGEGGHIEVWSSDSFSVVTGSLTSPGGTGSTISGGGHIEVDGFVWQEQGDTP